ncbi:MAG: hypothetical protein AB7O68_08205 [Pirellulales bacterium]
MREVARVENILDIRAKRPLVYHSSVFVKIVLVGKPEVLPGFLLDEVDVASGESCVYANLELEIH